MIKSKVLAVTYKAIKFNKCDTQYESTSPIPSASFLTERVKIEKFQGFSKAYNLAEYFRLRGTTSWKSGEQVTGIWKTNRPLFFYGDKRTQNNKTLLIFRFNETREKLRVYVFPQGYYPSKDKILSIVSGIK